MGGDRKYSGYRLEVDAGVYEKRNTKSGPKWKQLASMVGDYQGKDYHKGIVSVKEKL